MNNTTKTQTQVIDQSTEITPEIIPKFKTKFKNNCRTLIYPTLTYIRNIILTSTYNFKKKLSIDKLYLGQRGTDYIALRKKVNTYKSIRNSKIFIAGCGAGTDISSWLTYKPEIIDACDYFNYTKSWKKTKLILEKKYSTQINFFQNDIYKLENIKNSSYDIVGSDAVFEHLSNFDIALKEFHRILKPGGILYATFGPLWYCWGGDHISGTTSNVKDGYNHLLLDKNNYNIFLNSFGEHHHSAEDGRTWLNNEMFSYLKPHEYINKLDSSFKKLHISAIIDENALKFQKQFSKKFKFLENEHILEDLIIKGLTIIYQKT